MAHHRKPPMFGIPEHPAEKFHAHSMNLDALTATTSTTSVEHELVNKPPFEHFC